MTTIDKSKPVLVTGVIGYVAGWLMKELLEAGITIPAPSERPQSHRQAQVSERIGPKILRIHKIL